METSVGLALGGYEVLTGLFHLIISTLSLRWYVFLVLIVDKLHERTLTTEVSDYFLGLASSVSLRKPVTSGLIVKLFTFISGIWRSFLWPLGSVVTTILYNLLKNRYNQFSFLVLTKVNFHKLSLIVFSTR